MDGSLFSKHITLAEIEAGIDHVLASPRDNGSIELIVRRPKINGREVIDKAELDIEKGLIGDNWITRGSSRTDNGLDHPDMQLNLMNARMAELIAGSGERMKLAGDQLFVDLDLSKKNLPPGTRIAIGTAVIEVTAIPHLGCKKFVERFGLDALNFVNSEIGKQNNLRGINAKVVVSGEIATGDQIRVHR